MTFTIATTLAGNVASMADQLAEALSQFHEPTRVVSDVTEADLVWMCGLELTRQSQMGEIAGTIVVAPVFEGESTAVYRSVYVQHCDRLATSHRWALNEPESWSGNHVVKVERRTASADLLRADRIVWSGSHVESLAMVNRGEADIAAIDSSVWTWKKPDHPQLVATGSTADWPAPPLLARPHIDHGLIRRVLLSLPVQIDGLVRFEAASSDDYLAMYEASLQDPQA